MRGRAEAALADLTRTPPPRSRESGLAAAGMFAEADSVVSFGECRST